MKAHRECVKKRPVVNFIATDYFEKFARYTVEAANYGNRREMNRRGR